MKKSIISIMLLGAVVIFLLIFARARKEPEQAADKAVETEETVNAEEEEKIEFIKERTESGREETDIKRSKRMGERARENKCVNLIINKNQDMIEDFLINTSSQLKWIEINFFDFTHDRKMEIILTKAYIPTPASSPISYSYVYDQWGNELFAFLGGYELHVYTDRSSEEFYIHSRIAWGSQNYTDFYSKLVKREDWEKETIGVWDTRKAGQINTEESYLTFNIIDEKESEIFTFADTEMAEVARNKKWQMNEEQSEKYFQSYENMLKREPELYGIIRYAQYDYQDRIFLEVNGEEKTIRDMGQEKADLYLEQLKMAITDNKFEEFVFEPEEKVICTPVGTAIYDSMHDKIALYKETAGKDIVFVNLVYVERETGNVSIWEGEDLIAIGTLENTKLGLPDTPELEIKQDLQNISADELLDRAVNVLKQNGHDNAGLLYDGVAELIDMRYYVVSETDNTDGSNGNRQSYYINRESGYLYRVGEATDALRTKRTELYYVGAI